MQLLDVIFQAACQVSLHCISIAAIIVMIGGNSNPRFGGGCFRTNLFFFLVAFSHHSSNQDESGYRPDVEDQRRSTFRTGQHANAQQAARNKPPFSLEPGKPFIHAPDHDSLPCIHLSTTKRSYIGAGLLDYQCNRSV
jgi:hypothetical protein